MNIVSTRINRTFLAVSACLLFIAATTTAGAEDMELIEKGREVYNGVAGIGCKTCHGDYAEGDLGVGPFIRGASAGAVRAAIGAVGEMIVIRQVIKEDEIIAVAAYLEHLGTLQVARTLSKRGRFVPKKFDAYPGTAIQLVIKNSGTQAQQYVSENMDIAPLEVAGRSTNSLIWTAPEEEGVYTVSCVACKLDDEFTIEVNRAAKPFIGSKPVTKLKADTSGM